MHELRIDDTLAFFGNVFRLSMHIAAVERTYSEIVSWHGICNWINVANNFYAKHNLHSDIIAQHFLSLQTLHLPLSRSIFFLSLSLSICTKQHTDTCNAKRTKVLGSVWRLELKIQRRFIHSECFSFAHDSLRCHHLVVCAARTFFCFGWCHLKVTRYQRQRRNRCTKDRQPDRLIYII